MASVEPEVTVTPENPKSEPNPEPLPEWETAFQVWSYWWEIHNYGFGCAFAILAIFSIFCLVRLRNLQKLTLGRYFTTVSALLLVFTTSRTLYLLLDPYEAHKYITLPVVFVRVVFALGYPCLTSVFSLINFAFVEVNNLKTIWTKLQNKKFLFSIILGHFVLVLVIYLVVTFSPQLAKLFIICQSILIAWWIVLVICFLYSALLVIWNQKVKTKYINQDTKINETSSNDGTEKSKNTESIEQRRGTRKIIRISGAVAISGIISVVLEFYSLFGVYKLYALEDGFVGAWPWWSFQTASRAVEIILCCIVAYVVFPTLRRRADRSYTITKTRFTNEARKTTGGSINVSSSV